MPTRWNLDHQYQILDGGIVVAPGDPHDFTDEQLADGIAGEWADEDPRRGLPEEHEFKQRRNRSKTGDTPTDEQPDTPADTSVEQPADTPADEPTAPPADEASADQPH
jgi:hypothetical protein